jgi:hypothetical protein
VLQELRQPRIGDPRFRSDFVPPDFGFLSHFGIRASEFGSSLDL